MPRTIADIISKFPKQKFKELSHPSYVESSSDSKVMMACEIMKRHTTDEGWQLQLGLDQAGYTLAGGKLQFNSVDTDEILRDLNPGTLVIQDKREWDGRTASYSRKDNTWMKFVRTKSLANRDDVFKLTVLKDAHGMLKYFDDFAKEVNIHAWIVYYNPIIVKSIAPYVRQEHCIRTYHSVNASIVPAYRSDRRGAILSGAVSSAYPLRQQLIMIRGFLPETDYYPHPGYGHTRCLTPSYLKKLSRYKVAICTSSKYGYTLRKMIEATCCGCKVVTDLPTDETFPVIEENIVRVDSIEDVMNILPELYSNYDPLIQKDLSDRAKEFYDYRAVGKRLSDDIESLRQRYNNHDVASSSMVERV